MDENEISPEAKVVIENNPVVIATTTPGGRPNAIAVAGVKVINATTLLVSDVFMNQTLIDLEKDPSVTLLSWSKDMNGFKMFGTAIYFASGEWFEKVKTLPENVDLKPKGAILITIAKIFKTA